MEEELLSEIRGEISSETVPCMHVEWKVPDTLLKSDTDSVIHSPSFNFKDASWFLRLKTYAKKHTPYDTKRGAIDLHLVKSNAATLTGRFNFNIGIKMVGEKSYYRVIGCTPDYYLKNVYECWGKHNLFRRSQISGEKNIFAPNGIVTLFCYFWICIVENLRDSWKINYDDQSNMMSSQLTSENTGEISIEVVTIMHVKWKVRDIHLLSGDSENRFRTSYFQFTDETWYLQMTIHNAESEDNATTGTIDIHLVRKDCTTPALHVIYKLWIKDVDGNTYCIALSEDIIHRNLKFSQPKTLSRFVEKIIQAPNGEVTFFCYLLLVNDTYFVADVSSEITEGSFSREEMIMNHPSVDDDASYSLSHGLKNLGADFKNLFLSGEDSDVTIRVKDKEFKAHKNILRARSTVFHSMFSHDMTEKNSGTIDIPDLDPDAFEIFLLYLYSGSMENFSTNTVFDLFRAADKYNTEELKLKCKEFMITSLSVEIVCDVVEHALQYHEAELLETAAEFFAKNFKSVILTVKWQTFMKKNTVAANELLIKVSNNYVLKE